MGRKAKYVLGTKLVTISIDATVLNRLDSMTSKLGKSRSEMITAVLENRINNDVEFARMKAKEHNRQFHYWKSEMERLEQEKSEGL